MIQYESLNPTQIVPMMEVVVYLKQDYSINESIWVSCELTKDEITELVNNKFPVWFYYDIL